MASRAMRYDYITVGHVTVDVVGENGSFRRTPGGGAFYSALQASRLGLRTLILTRGLASELETLLEPYLNELSLHVIPAQSSTSFATSGSGTERLQRLLSWAGPIQDPPALESPILHFAPVAQETSSSLIEEMIGPARFVGITPQGLLRRWPDPGGEVSLAALQDHSLPSRYDAAVISEQELASCEALLHSLPRGAVLAVTAGPHPTTLYLPGPRGESDKENERPRARAWLAERTTAIPTSMIAVPPSALPHPVDDLGAGDVFAAAFFIALHEGASPERAAIIGNAAAAIRISGAGPGAIGERPRIEALARA